MTMTMAEEMTKTKAQPRPILVDLAAGELSFLSINCRPKYQHVITVGCHLKSKKLFCYPIAQLPLFGHMGIWAYWHMRKKTCANGVSLKRVSKMMLRDVRFRSAGHSNKKLWPKINFRTFFGLFPISTDQIKTYGALGQI